MARDLKERSPTAPRARSRGKRRRRPRLDQLIVRWLLVLIVLSALTLLAFRALRSGSLPNVELSGTNVGGLDQQRLIARVEEIAAEREAQEVEVQRPGTGNEAAVTRRYARSELGYKVDVDATVEQILERGRQGNPLAAFADQLVSSFATIKMDPIVTLDQDRFDRWLARVQKQLATEANEGGLTFGGGRVTAMLPRSGIAIAPEALREVTEEAILDDDDPSLTAPVEEIEPDMTVQEVRRAEGQARKILSAQITLESGGEKTELQPQHIAAALSASEVDEGGTTRILLKVNAAKLASVASSPLKRLGEEPSDASFDLTNGRVRVLRGHPGTEVDADKLADSLIRIALSSDRTATAPMTKVPPAFSTRDAKGLHIQERVSSFTTYHSCCEARVENIHRIADIIDGTVVQPGEEFSINNTVGQRTAGNGFVGAPAISNGEYVEEVGGGISQFATTIFNATFFGGFDFFEYKTHSYYISRYPMGREATVSWPAPDFRFLNDSDSGIYIDTSYSETSITVTFYGRKERTVTSLSGEPHNYKAPPIRCQENDSLKKRQNRVVQTGSRGFDITVTRVFGDGSEEDFFTTYLPVPEIVEKRKCK